MPHYFDRDRNFEFSIDTHRPIDGPHPATSDLGNDLIRPNAATD
jgi:hypothetical protein